MKLLKLKMILNIIMGRPVMYKIYLKDGIVTIKKRKAIIVNCTIDNSDVREEYLL